MGILVDWNLRNRSALDHIDRIAVGGEYHTKRGIVVIPSEFRSLAIEQSADASAEIRRELRQHDFRFRIAKTSIELDDLRTIRGGDQAA